MIEIFVYYFFINDERKTNKNDNDLPKHSVYEKGVNNTYLDRFEIRVEIKELLPKKQLINIARSLERRYSGHKKYTIFFYRSTTSKDGASDYALEFSANGKINITSYHKINDRLTKHMQASNKLVYRENELKMIGIWKRISDGKEIEQYRIFDFKGKYYSEYRMSNGDFWQYEVKEKKNDDGEREFTEEDSGENWVITLDGNLEYRINGTKVMILIKTDSW